MSKIALEGNVSGSGTLTIAAPNTNSNFTLSLPTNTGTIVTQNSTPAFASTIGVGGATPSTSGAGITFPAAQSASSNANTLDDYEEGTWSPVVSGATTAGTYETDAFTAGQYTKIGRQVTLVCSINMAASITGGGSGALIITGLPFEKAGNSHAPVGAVTLYGLDFTGDYCNIQFPTGSASSVLYIPEIRDNNTPLELPISAISANDRIVLTITYFV